MSSHQAQALLDLQVDHVTLYATDVEAASAEFVERYGFEVWATSAEGRPARTVAVGRSRIHLLITQAVDEEHPAAIYTEQHGDGVADIALATPDARAAFTEAVRRGARPVAAPAEQDGVITASIMAFGDVQHTFVQRGEGSGDAAERRLPGLVPQSAGQPDASTDTGLRVIDHFAVCLEPGQLDATVEFYERVLDFRMTFTEQIVVGGQSMNSKVVQSASGGVTLTLIEPDTTREPGQIDEFIKNHSGAGVQHVAFASDNIIESVGQLRDAGVGFLSTPAAYYQLLADRLQLSRYAVEDLGELHVLADEDHDGQLFQIFTRSVHPRRTLFFEVIERVGATTFGSGNIKALYEAVEAEHLG